MKKEEFIQEFAKNFKNMVKNNFGSQKEFAEIFNEGTVNIHSWCTGKAIPDIYKLHKIAEYLGVSIDYIVKGEPHGKETQNLVDYDLMEKVEEFVNNIAKETNKKPKVRQYLAVYENVASMLKLYSKEKVTLEQVFNILKPTITEAWRV